jgi:hypothetical protein
MASSSVSRFDRIMASSSAAIRPSPVHQETQEESPRSRESSQPRSSRQPVGRQPSRRREGGRVGADSLSAGRQQGPRPRRRAGPKARRDGASSPKGRGCGPGASSPKGRGCRRQRDPRGVESKLAQAPDPREDQRRELREPGTGECRFFGGWLGSEDFTIVIRSLKQPSSGEL